MAVVKHHLADAYLRSLPETTRAILVYGPDSGLVSERIKLALSSFGAALDDPFSSLRLGEEELRKDPGRLADECLAVAMFGGKRTIQARPGGVDITGAIKAIAGIIPDDTLLIVEAGDLRATAPLRKLFESSEAFVAVPCYADTAEDIGKLIDEQLAAAGLEIASDARAVLMHQLGGDRLASRLELEKLILFAHGTARIELEDVVAVSGDASAARLDDLVDSAGLGDAEATDLATQRHLRAGAAPAELVAAALRHFMQLHELRTQIDAGEQARSAVQRARPPVFFKRVDPVVRQCGLWNTNKLARALDILHDAERQSRTVPVPALMADCAGRALLSVAVLAKAGR